MMSPQVKPVRDFVLMWLRRRERNPRTHADASQLSQPLLSILGAVPAGLEIADRFVDLVEARLASVVDLSKRWGGEVESGGTSQASSWRRDARVIQSEWYRDDPDSWWSDLLRITEAGNQLAAAIVSTSLVDVLDPSLTVKPPLSALRRLRAGDESPFSDLTVPPGPGAPWDASDYLIHPEYSENFEAIQRVMAAIEADAIGPTSGAARFPSLDSDVVRNWERHSLAYQAGQPVARGPMLAIVDALCDLVHAGLTQLSRSLDETARAFGGRDRNAPTRPPGVDNEVSVFDQRLTDLIGALDREGSPEARTFGRRVVEILAATGRNRARLLLGGLIHLDQIKAESGRVQEWVRIGRSTLLELARTLEDCEVIDEELVGRQIRQVADLVNCIRVDDQARPGASHRITKVERPGYALRLPDGDRQVLAPAQVWVSP